jgi:hypothetical protein
MSPGLGGVFQPLKEVILRELYHSSTASVYGSFARDCSAFTGLFQA